MKVKVLQSFIDDKAKTIRLKGAVIEMAEKRYKEIMSKKAGLLAKEPEKETETETEEEQKEEQKEESKKKK